MRSFGRSFLLLITSFLFMPSLKAQWIKLPPAKSAFTSPGSCNKLKTSGFLIRPLSDERIIYASLCESESTHNSPYGYFMISDDDLSTAKVFRSTEEPWAFNCLGRDEFSHGGYIQGKSSAYYIGQSGLKALGGRPGFIVATAITPNYVYSAYLFNPAYIDRHDKSAAMLISSTLIPDMYSYYEKLNFLNDSVGFNLCNFKSNSAKTALVKISNFGATWQPLLVDSVDAIVDYQAFASGTIFVLKKSGAVHKSTNGGLTFLQLTSAPQGTYTCIRFGDSNTGLIGGENGSLVRTQDGGNNWMSENSTTTKRITAIYSFESSSYFVTESNQVYRSAQPLAVSEAVYKNEALSVFPNPAKDVLTVNYPATHEVTVEISDLAGRVITRSAFRQSLQVDVSAYSAGVYMVRVRDEKRVLAVKKLVVGE